MRQYKDLVRHVLANGTRKENRTGVDTISTFGYYYEHDLREGFPLLTTKHVEWKHIVIELLWFLTGTNGQDFLERHGIKFWRPWYRKDGNVNAAYGPAWRRFEYPSYYESDSGLSCMDGPCTGYNDQIGWVVRQLREKPMRRDLVVSAWQPHIVQYPPTTKTYWAPCHCMFILNVQNEELFQHNYTVYSGKEGRDIGFVTALNEPDAEAKARDKFGEGPFEVSDTQSQFELAVAKGKRWNPEGSPNGWLGEPLIPAGHQQRLCLHLTQRSCDIALGVPYNLASYALLCSILARLGGLEPGIFGHSLVDTHVYTKKPDGSKAEYDHIPGLLEQVERPERPLPRLIIDDSIQSLKDIEALLDPKVTTDEIMGLFRLEGYDPHPKIKFKVAV